MRIVLFLSLILLVQACTNTENNNTTIVENKESATIDEKSQDMADEVPVTASEAEETGNEEVTQPITKTRSATSEPTQQEAEYIVFSVEGLDLLKKALDKVNEIEDGVEGFAAFEKSTLASLQAILADVDTSILFTSTRSGNTRKGAFDESINQSEEEAFRSSRVNRNSLEYIRRPKPLIEKFSGYKIELMTVFNRSLALSDDLFKTFGGLTYRHKTDNSTTYYLGDFPTKEALEDYLNKVVISRFPEARGVKFKNGMVTNYK